MSKRAKPTLVDSEDPEWTEEMFAKAKRGTAAARRRVGRPAGSDKVSTTIRFDAEVIDVFKQAGPGWQTRMNAALKDWLKTHDPQDVA